MDETPDDVEPELPYAEPAELPRLRLIHLMGLTAMTAVALVPMNYQQESLARFRSEAVRTVGDFELAMALANVVWGIASGGCLFVVAALVTWRRQGYQVQIQPGHWFAIQNAYRWSVAATMGVMLRPLNEMNPLAYVLIFGGQITGGVGFFIGFLYLARQRVEPTIWRWCYAVLALATPVGLVLGMGLMFAGGFRSRPLVERLALTYIAMAAAYCTQSLVLLAAMMSDSRNARRRHWTHILAVGLEVLLVASSALTSLWMWSKLP